MAITKKRREDEELKDRTEQSHGTWEEVYRNANRAIGQRMICMKGMKESLSAQDNHCAFMNCT
ncbi:transferring glycosyl group transferase [Sesbania bispinosa]|nr:transferring glycosyl group transferase [Sesbania bispinosa]